MVTVSPGLTSTAVSTPLVTKLTGVASDDWELPLAVTEAVTVPRVTATVRSGLGFGRGANAVISAKTRMTITSTARPMLSSSVRRRSDRSHATKPDRREGLDGVVARARLGEQAATFDVLSHGLPRSAVQPEYRGRHDGGTEKALSWAPGGPSRGFRSSQP